MSAEPLSNLVESAPKVETSFSKTVTELYGLVRDALPLVGGAGIAADIMGVDRGDLTRALNRASRYLAVEHVMALTEGRGLSKIYAIAVDPFPIPATTAE